VKERIVVGSRGSRLALAQAREVMAAIGKMNPHLELMLRKIVTAGDLDRQTRLDRMGTAIFVKELEEALLDGVIDLAVHSLKDIPIEVPPGLHLSAVMARLDPRDALVAGSKLDDLPAGSGIGTGSLRRAAQLLNYRPDLEVRGLRGNVDTRLGKAAAGEVDGVIVAVAAMARLGREREITEYLPPEHFLPAAGQGALALESRIDDEEMAGVLASLDHLPTRRSVTAERAFLGALGGGCRAPIAALGTVAGGTLRLEGMVADASGARVLRASEEGEAASPEEIGERLARKMLAMGASDLIVEARSA
jgi:hydroxymethylbilane synthase